MDSQLNHLNLLKIGSMRFNSDQIFHSKMNDQAGVFAKMNLGFIPVSLGFSYFPRCS
jgi:hypothetical protein